MRTMFTPLKIAGMEVKNRTFMAPMSLGYESQDGTVNEKMEAYWLRRAQGGVGCIIVDATSVDPNVPYLGNTLCFRDEESIKKYKSFTDKVHSYGCKIIPQITHPGPESISAFFGVAPVASSSYPNSMGQMTRELTKEELPGIVALYAKASKNAKEAGFDGIELHCAHAYMLLGSFLSPLRNKRTDEYGGSLLNRARLLFEVLDAIKETCGEDFPIVLRMSGSERDPQGNTLEDMKRLIPYLEKHGVDCFEISGGTQYEHCNKIIPCHGEEEFTNLKEARAIKAITAKPVITVGKILDAQLAEDVIETNEVDGVVLGRALLADPDFVEKAEEKRYDEIAPCAGCGVGCVGEQTKRRPASCVINPLAGRETEFEEKPAQPKSNLASMGIYIFTWSKLKKYLEEDEANPESENDFGKNVIPAMLQNGERMYAYAFQGYWKDVGTIDSLWEANMDLLDPNVPLDLYDDAWKIYARNPVMPPQYVAEGAVTQNSMISEGCIVEGDVDFSILFAGVTVEKGAVVHDSIIMPGSVIKAGAVVEYSIVAENVVVGENAQAGDRPENIEDKANWGVTVIAKGIHIGKNAKVPAKAMIEKDVPEVSGDVE